MKVRLTMCRVLCACLVCVVLASSGICHTQIFRKNTAYAAWDGYIEPEVTDMTFSVLDFNSIKSIEDAGASASNEYAADGNMYSAHWNNHTVNQDFYIKSLSSSVPSDWSQYSKISMKIYSKKATGAKIFMGIFSPTTSAGSPYFSTYLYADWEGWKTLTFKLGDLNISRSPSLTNIIAFRLCADGNWNLTGNPETDLYISSIKVSGFSDGTDFINDFYDDTDIEKTYASLENSVAVYANGVNAVTDNGPEEITYAIGYVNNTVTVPAVIFKDYLGAEVSDNSKSYTITLGENSISGSAGSSTAFLNGKEFELASGAYVSDNMCYVPGEQIAEALNLKSFTDGKLLVMGTQTAVDTLRRPGNIGVNYLNEIAAYRAYRNPVNLADFTADDCKAVKDNWRLKLVGNEITNDMTDPDIASKVEGITKSAKNKWATLIKTAQSDELFTTITTTESADMRDAYGYVEDMALAYACYGSELYKNEALLNDIIYSLDWLYENRFSETGVNKWKVTGFDNWWDWDIGAPGYLVNTLLCIEDKLPPEKISAYLSYFDKDNPKPTKTGANYCDLAEIIFGSAILQNDCKKAVSVLVGLQKEYLYVDDNKRTTEFRLVARDFDVPVKGAGFFTDGSYVLHTLHAMNGSYGGSHFTSIMAVQQYLKGTKFDLEFPAKENFVNFFKDSFDSLIFETTLFRGVMGRSVNPNNGTSAVSYLINGFRLANTLSDENVKNEIYSIIKAAYNASADNIKASFLDPLSINEIKTFKSLINDDAIVPRSDRKTSKIFYNMDKSFHVRNNWAFGVSMSSKRIFNYESINDQNTDGWYMGDGRTEYYLSGSYMNGTSQYWASMDKYRLPGTTVDTQERKAVSVNQGNEYLSSKEFVGGVSLNSEYSASAMELESYHSDTDFGATASYGGPNPAHKNDLTAKKSYFMLDDGVICLGSAVNAKDNNDAEVLTIVDNPLASKTFTISDVTAVPYTIVSAVASHTPEVANVAENTIDGSYSTKWAGTSLNEIVWDLGEAKNLGFANISLLNGAKRQQYMELLVSEDGNNWVSVYDGASSGNKETEEAFDLKNSYARYVKYINKGNSLGSSWVSITECCIYPPNPDGTIGTQEPEIYGADPIMIDGEEITLLGEDKVISGSQWVNFNNTVGYYFPQNASLNGGELKCRWTRNAQPHFELWFSHGVNPTDGGYAYVLLPGKTNEQTAEFASSDYVSVLANTPDLQAAKDNRTGITYYVFWKEGSFGDITVAKPCMVIAKETSDGIEISVSDPTQKLTENKVTVNKALKLVSGDEYASCEYNANSTVIKLNMENSVGRSFEFKFEK